MASRCRYLVKLGIGERSGATSADYLGNSGQAPKGRAVKNPVAVALKRISLVLGACGISPLCAFRAKNDQF